jgi:hypothetical protein
LAQIASAPRSPFSSLPPRFSRRFLVFSSYVFLSRSNLASAIDSSLIRRFRVSFSLCRIASIYANRAAVRETAVARGLRRYAFSSLFLRRCIRAVSCRKALAAQNIAPLHSPFADHAVSIIGA